MSYEQQPAKELMMAKKRTLRPQKIGPAGFSVIKSPVTRRMEEAMPSKEKFTEKGKPASDVYELTPGEATGAAKAAGGITKAGFKSVPVKGSKQGATRELDPKTGRPLAPMGVKAGAVKRPFTLRHQPPSPEIAKVRAASAAKKKEREGEKGEKAG